VHRVDDGTDFLALGFGEFALFKVAVDQGGELAGGEFVEQRVVGEGV
jgi:hypothetical protein